MKEIWVWCEHNHGEISNVSLEILNKALQLKEDYGRINSAATVVGLVIGGKEAHDVAKEYASWGADKVYTIINENLSMYQPMAFTRIISEMASAEKPEIFLIGGTYNGSDLAPRVAARLKTGLTAHCIDLKIEEIEGKSLLVQYVPGFGGNLMVKIVCPDRRPQMATVRPGVMQKPEKKCETAGEIITNNINLDEGDLSVRTLEIISEKPAHKLLEEADIIVSAGWGFAASGDISLAEKLAESLGAALGGTRPVVDKAWLSEDQMIGQSGKNVRPRIFISIGASGAVHYTTGFKDAKIIVAVNTNKDAPIFDMCDIGLVGSLEEIIPEFMEELQNGGI